MMVQPRIMQPDLAGPLRALYRRVRERTFYAPIRNVPQHVFLSHPKSGRTWVRFMLDLYLMKKYGRSMQHVFEIEKDPFVHRRHRIKYTHFTDQLPYYDMGNFKERATLVPKSHAVLLARNIYATLASGYCHVRYRIGQVITPGEYLRGTKFGALKIITFYNLWLQLRKEFLSARVFSYEALKTDTEGVLRQILQAVGIKPVDEALLSGVVEESSFRRMQELSLSEAYKDTVLGPGDSKNQNSWKVREGKVDGFREIFSAEDLEYIRGLIDDLLIDKTIVDISL